MKIQVVSLSFYPDHTGISLYSSDFAFYAAEQGHTVDVITGYPFYPHWKKRTEDEGRLFSTDRIKGIRILRGYFYVPAKPTTVKRILQEITFLVFGFVNFFRSGKADVTVVFTAPITMGWMAGFFKKVYKSALVINVQDFQLEAASSLKMASSNWVFSFLGRLEQKSYRRADLVSSISDGMCKLLTWKGISASKGYLWPNWIDVKEYAVSKAGKGTFRRKYGIDDQTLIIAYAGNIGLKQGLESLVDLAAAFRHDKRVCFFMIGKGAGHAQLELYAAAKGADNLLFLPLFNQDDYKLFLTDLDIFFLSQRKTEMDIYFPSKLLGLMAARKLILLTADKDSELFKTIEKHGIGIATQYGDGQDLVKAVTRLIEDQGIKDNIEQAAMEYVSRFDREVVLGEVLRKLAELRVKK